MGKLALLAFVRPFFQKTLGFWTLALLIGGVLMEPAQHILIGRFLFKNPLAFWLLPTSIFLYGWIHLRIQLELVRKNEYHVFHQLGLFSPTDFKRFWSQILLLNFSPFLGYFLFLSYFAWEQKAHFLGISLWMLSFAVIFFNFIIIQKTLQQPLKETIIHRPSVRWTFPRFTWIILSIRNHRPILFLLTKAFSLLLLNGFFFSFQSGDYDIRWLQFGVLIVSYVQLPLILEKSDRELTHQSWTLGLPLTLDSKLGYQLGSLALLVFPELLFLIWNRLISSSFEHLLLAILLLSLSCVLQVLVYRKRESSSFPNMAAAMFFGLFLAIIFSLPWWAFVIGISFLFIHQSKRSFGF